MSSEDGEVYIMSDEGDDEEWVSPTPADDAVRDAVVEATDLDADDLDDLQEYVARDDLRDLLNGDDGELSFEIEDHDVTISADGTIEVD